jgi:integrase
VRSSNKTEHFYAIKTWRTDTGKRHTEYYGYWDAPDYEKLTADLKKVQANGGRWPTEAFSPTVKGLIGRFKQDHRYTGKSVGEQAIWDAAFKILDKAHGAMPAKDFSPEHLRTLQSDMGKPDPTTGKQKTRTTVNKYRARIVALFEFARDINAVSRDVVWQLREQAEPLKKGTSLARNTGKVKSVSDEQYQAILDDLSEQVRAMVVFGYLTGARPGEIRRLREADIKRPKDKDYWLWTPYEHKTEGYGATRVIQVPPAAMEILRPFLGKRAVYEHVFDYRVDSFRRAIRRACDRLGIPRWTPNQLRHAFITKATKDHGLYVASKLAGHSTTRTTEGYVDDTPTEEFDLVAAKWREQSNRVPS